MSKLQTVETQAGRPTDNLLSRSQIDELLIAAHSGGIEALEAHMLTCKQVDIPPEESIANGMYTRRIKIPKDTLLTGRVHKFPYVDIMLCGDIVIGKPEGTERLIGHNVCDGAPGRKRIGYALEDTEWITVHRTDQIQIIDMIDQLTFFSMDEYHVWYDRRDFVSMLLETGFTPDVVRQQSENTADYEPIGIEQYGLRIGWSARDGSGLFADYHFNPDEIMCPVRFAKMRTEAGRYTNHSATPNAEMQWVGDNAVMIAIKDIAPGDEVLVDYRQVLAMQYERVN